MGGTTMAGTIPSLDFSEAKSRLSDVMSAVVRDHQPRLVQRHRGKETMLLVRPDDLVQSLRSFHFEPKVVLDGDEVTVELERLGLVGFGATLAEAIEDLAQELRAYAGRFFERYQFYRETKRADHWPWLLRFALTPVDRQVELLLSDARPEGAQTG